MIRKIIFLAFLILSLKNITFADNNIIESWNDKDIDTGVSIDWLWAPPYNRAKDGTPHNRYGCIKRNVNPGGSTNVPGFPKAWTGYYENLCGERTNSSTYFKPSIRVRGQQCNAGFCWTTNNVLEGHGACIILAGGYGFPLHRMCARIAFSAESSYNNVADPGYTVGKQLDDIGAEIDDPKFVAHDDSLLTANIPKLCLYRDPSFFSTENNGTFDIMDLKDDFQPFHKTNDLDPVMEIIISILDIAGTVFNGYNHLSILTNALDQAAGNSDGNMTFLSVTTDILRFIGWIFETIVDAVELILQEAGKINNAVDSKLYGCVELPLAPYPPPFCDPMIPNKQFPSVYKICDGSQLSQITNRGDDRCVVSNVRNNYIHNSIRTSFDNFVPLCKNGEDPLSTDKCVVIENFSSLSADTMHNVVTNKFDIIPKCNNSNTSTVCINSSIPHQCQTSNPSCQGGFRIVYATKTASLTKLEQYFNDDLEDCSTTNSTHCQEIWGINTGEFIDTSVSFPQTESQSLVSIPSALTHDFSLSDKNGSATTFTTSIIRTEDPPTAENPNQSPNAHIAENPNQSPNEICVTSKEGFVGCVSRVKRPAPILSIDPNNDYYKPSFTVTYQDGTDKTSGVLQPRSIHNPSSPFNSLILAADELSSFVTNDSFQILPFSGSRAINGSTLVGTYRDNTSPSDALNDKKDIYLSGLEYREGLYHLGGTWACLHNLDADKCPINPKMCVLSKLINKNVVSCKTFKEKLKQHPGLRPCENIVDFFSCNSVIDSIPKKSGGVIDIKQCLDNSTCYTGGEELCIISSNPNDRFDPDPNIGPLLADSEYYDTSASTSNAGSVSGQVANYDQDLYGIRDKTAIELGLCVAIPQGSCAAEDNPSKDNGFATWTSANLGQISLGTCKTVYNAQSGEDEQWVPVEPLERVCVPNSNPDTPSIGNPKFRLEPLFRWRGIDKVYNDIKCEPPPNN